MLELKHIHKDYLIDKKPFAAIKDLNLVFPNKGFVAILGPSGCGKSTLLNMIGGLDHYTSGDLLIDGKSTKDFKDADWDSYRNKRIGFVFQSYNLISHYTVQQNVEISLLLNGTNKKDRSEKAIQVLKKVGLGDVLTKKPNQLSGGQMQRVAIARALINEPEVILADEPTGALDSKTSVQVLDLIKEVGQDHCVIMVTHNRDLAEKYADRIIEMKDGEILSDSAPISTQLPETGEKETNKKTHMSMATAVRSSGQSILTKRGRTTLTAIACSIGLIGVALVLATRNGFSNYVSDVESSVASSVPISVTPTVYNYLQNNYESKTERPDDVNVYVDNNSTTSYVTHRNKYTQDYFDYIEKTLPGSGDKQHQGLSSDIVYNRNGLDFHFLTEDGERTNDDGSSVIMNVNQYGSAGSVSSAIGSFTSLPTTVMHELYVDTKYDVVYGHYPQNKDEMVLIIDQYNNVSFSVLQSLGIIGSDAKSATYHTETIKFSDFVYDGEGDTSYKEYKCYRNSDYYQVDDDSNLWSYKYPNWDLEPVPSSSDYIEITGTKFYYKKTATTSTMKSYKAPSSYQACFNDDAKYNPIDCKIVGVIRPSSDSYISLMPASVGYLTELKDEMINDTTTKASKLIDIQKDNHFIVRAENDGEAGVSDMSSWKDGWTSLKTNVEKLSDSLALITDESDKETALTSAITTLFDNVYCYFSARGTVDGIPYTQNFSSSRYGNISYYQGVGAEFGDAVIPDTSDVDSWLNILMDSDFLNGGCMAYLAYFNSYDIISSVLIFPSALTTKQALRDYLDAYNTDARVADGTDIVYSDLMNDFTSSLGILINVISAVLIVFASISLVVSSVMTAIITYVSVIERTKEIGILRACGARKNDVGRLFEAECMITGFIAGIIGVGVSYLLCIPINLILDNQFPGNNLGNIANLNPLHALILLALSILLAFLSGLIPSRMAANKDPVTCLRSE